LGVSSGYGGPSAVPDADFLAQGEEIGGRIDYYQ
jgi:hypothetical protein